MPYAVIIIIKQKKMYVFLFQRNSVSPAEREKYRPRSPPELDDSKRRKEDKLTHVSQEPTKMAYTLTHIHNTYIVYFLLRSIRSVFSGVFYANLRYDLSSCFFCPLFSLLFSFHWFVYVNMCDVCHVCHWGPPSI